MLIRNLNYDDYNKYILLINSYLSQEKYNNFLKNILNDNHQILVIDDDDNNIIACGTIFIEPKMTHGGCLMGHIENILVDKNYRNKGLGEILVKKLLDIAKKRGCYRTDLTCNNELENFYKKNNFNKNQISMSILFEENFPEKL